MQLKYVPQRIGLHPGLGISASAPLATPRTFNYNVMHNGVQVSELE